MDNGCPAKVEKSTPLMEVDKIISSTPNWPLVPSMKRLPNLSCHCFQLRWQDLVRYGKPWQAMIYDMWRVLHSASALRPFRLSQNFDMVNFIHNLHYFALQTRKPPQTHIFAVSSRNRRSKGCNEQIEDCGERLLQVLWQESICPITAEEWCTPPQIIPQAACKPACMVEKFWLVKSKTLTSRTAAVLSINTDRLINDRCFDFW